VIRAKCSQYEGTSDILLYQLEKEIDVSHSYVTMFLSFTFLKTVSASYSSNRRRQPRTHSSCL